MDALAFLARPPAAAGSLYVLHGDEAFLKRQVLQALRDCALGGAADEQAVSVQAGDRATFAEVFDELETVPFFSTRRLLIVENADPFVTRYRADLERKVAHLPATGTLILDVKSWPANTRLAKLVDPAATIVCTLAKGFRFPAWCSEWAQGHYGKQLPAPAAALLVELVGPELGQLDQELLKLTIYVGKRNRIDVADVDRLVGNSRTESVWKILDAAGAGNVKDALATLHRLLDQGEAVQMILGALGAQLRKLAQAYRLTLQGQPANAALIASGVPPFATRGAEQQLRHLGRRRLEQLYEMLLQVNLELRGNSMLPERTQLERFVVRLARKSEGGVA